MASGPGIVRWTLSLTAFKSVAPGLAKAKIESAIQQIAGLCFGKFQPKDQAR